MYGVTGARQRLRDAGMPYAARIIDRPRHGDPRRLLILQPDHLGDILLSQPAVRALRDRRPDHELIAVVGPWSEEITRLAWPVDRIVTVGFPGFTRSARGRVWSPYLLLRREAARLRDLRAGAAIVLRPDAWWAAWLARASVPGDVCAYDDVRVRPFVTRAATASGDHRTIQAMAVVALVVGGELEADRSWDMSPAVALPPGAVERARGLSDRFGIPEGYLVFHPGAGSRVKLWPVSRWRALIDSLTGTPIVLTGARSERALCGAIAAGHGHAVNIAGDTDLGALAAVLRGALAAVGTDNGALHLAGAVGTPTVRLFGPSEPFRYGPLPGSGLHRVVHAGWRCLRCGDLGPDRDAGCGCMVAISVPQVKAAIDEVMRAVDAA